MHFGLFVDVYFFKKIIVFFSLANTRKTHVSVLHFITLYCPQIICILFCVTPYYTLLHFSYCTLFYEFLQTTLLALPTTNVQKKQLIIFQIFINILNFQLSILRQRRRPDSIEFDTRTEQNPKRPFCRTMILQDTEEQDED